MKRSILLLFLTSAIVNAGDEPSSVSKPVVQQAAPVTTATTVSQLFEEADISLAVAQYKRLKEMAFELKLELELIETRHTKKSQEAKMAEVDALSIRIRRLDEKAAELRVEVEARAAN